MIADLVTSLNHSLGEIGMLLHEASKHEECCLGVPLPQHVKGCRSPTCVWPIIERERRPGAWRVSLTRSRSTPPDDTDRCSETCAIPYEGTHALRGCRV